MKKTLITLFVLLAFLFTFNTSFAADEVLGKSSTSAEKQTVDYELAYPGILPDHPFYVVKVIRDAITRFFISDSFKKAEFDLLQADKRLNAGYYLFLKGENQEKKAIETISKGENYFDNAIKEAVEAEKGGIDINGFWEKMFLSTKKHQEILNELMKKVSKENSVNLQNELKRVQNFEELVNKLKSD